MCRFLPTYITIITDSDKKGDAAKSAGIPLLCPV